MLGLNLFQCFYSSGASQLSCLGSIQNKITVCATSDSYQTTRERMTQAEEESRNRSAKVIKPGGPFLGMVVFHFLIAVCKISNSVIHLFSASSEKVVSAEVSGVGSLPSLGRFDVSCCCIQTLDFFSFLFPILFDWLKV